MKKIILFCLCVISLHFSLANAGQKTSNYGLRPGELYCADDTEQKHPVVVMFNETLNKLFWDRPDVAECARVDRDLKLPKKETGIFEVSEIPYDVHRDIHFTIRMTLLHKKPFVIGVGYIYGDGSFSIENEVTPDNNMADKPTLLIFKLLR